MLSFLVTFILLQITVTLFLWVINLLNISVIYRPYVANTSQLIKHALSHIADIIKECIAFICMVAVLRSGYDKNMIVSAGLLLLCAFMQKNFHEGLTLLIRMHIMYTFLKAGAVTDVIIKQQRIEKE